MPAKLMIGKYDEIKKYLKEEKKLSGNEIEHLLANRNELSIESLKVKTHDGEVYELPYRFVYVIKDGKNGKAKNRA